MKKKNVAHIISHTHWDREWYLNSKYTNEWLVEFFDRLFEMLEKEQEYVFVLDGQTAMIEDYFDELKKQGKGVTIYKEKIKKYAGEGRLAVGPYYLQPDWQLVSDEALVRNMLIGNKTAREFGNTMKVGWMLDNFGQISQTAQLHKGCGMKGLYVWRGVEMDPENVQSEFLWEAPDGTQLPSVYLLNSYRNAMRLAEYQEIMKHRIYDEVEKLRPFAMTPNVLLMNGYDQEMIPDDLLPYIKNGQLDSEEVKIVQSNPERYMDELIQHKPELNVLKGALYSGRFIAVFPGVLSSRMYLKLQNDRCQKSLEKYAEPLSMLIWALGGEYEGNNLEQAWKTLLKNHPHDSICGVSIDDVHTDMEERFRIVEKMTMQQIEAKAKELAALIDTSKGGGQEAFVIFNPSTYVRNEVVSIGEKSRWIKDIPALGYKVVHGEKEEGIEKPVTAADHVIENGKIRVEILDDGSFNLIHKDTGKSYEGLGIFEDSGDAGDEYNYSYPNIDKIITSKGKKAEIEFVEKCEERVKVKIKTVLEVPEALTEDRKQRSAGMRKLPIVTYITVDANTPFVACRTEVKNTVKDHRLRVLFPTNINTDVSFAGSAFDVVERPIYIEGYDESTIPQKVKKVIVGAREAKPNTIFPQREFVDLNDSDGGLAVLSKGLPEYQIIPEENTIALTLFRSVGWITEEINTRIGDAGPKIFTPDAQCLRHMVFEYAVYPHEGDVVKGRVPRTADIFNTNLLVVKTTAHAGLLPQTHGFLNVEDEKQVLKVTTVKRSEDGKAVLLRCYNPSDERVMGKIYTDFTIEKAAYVNLLEELQEAIEKVEGHRIEIVVHPRQIVTIRLEIQRKQMDADSYHGIEIMDTEFPEDFREYESLPLVTKEDITSEMERAEELERELNNPMVRRTALEAMLSVILTNNKFTENEIRQLGYKLNAARVQRRVYDYIMEYFKKQ
ncbi:MAG: alpha-mannosidase [Bacillota bacterium]